MVRMFSGIQPTGNVHIGNYFGALRFWVELAQKNESLFCIVDYHAITAPTKSGDLKSHKTALATTLLSIGLDPNKSTLFFQSDVPEHTELAWIFSTLAPFGMLERMTQFKDKSEQHADSINAGLFCYPVLQSADILLYKATGVPVGKDQEQHLELTREIARKFNNAFGNTFAEPQTLLGKTPKIIGLDGKAKMSKSKGNTIDLVDTPEDIQKKLKGAFTDPQRLRRNDPGRPEVCNIFSLHHLVQGNDRISAIEKDCRAATLGCGDCKKEFGEKLSEMLAPIRERHQHWSTRPKEVLDIFKQGGQKARTIAQETMREVRQKMGLAFALLLFLCVACSSDEEKGPPSVSEMTADSPIKNLKSTAPTNVFYGWTEDQISRYMIQFTKDLDTECTACHDDDMENVVNHKEISRSMIHMSLTFKAQCKDCHTGLSTLNKLGKVALAMKKKYTDKLEVPCASCHIQGTFFKLNNEGLIEQRRLKAARKLRQR